MYEIYENLLKEKGVKSADVSRATGIVSSTFSDWKKGKSSPKQDKLQKLADYFGVTVKYLLTGKDDRFSDGNTELDIKILLNDDIRELAKKYSNMNDDDKKKLMSYADFLLN